jgi:hypothetical protein
MALLERRASKKAAIAHPNTYSGSRIVKAIHLALRWNMNHRGSRKRSTRRQTVLGFSCCGTLRCRIDQVQRKMMDTELQTISMVDRMLGACTNAGADAGNEHTGLNVIILRFSFVLKDIRLQKSLNGDQRDFLFHQALPTHLSRQASEPS